MGSKARALRENCDIGVHQTPSKAGRAFPNGGQQSQTVSVAVARIGIGEMASEVAFAERPQDRVRERMRGDVGVRMTAKTGRMLDFDTAKYELSAFFEWMEVKPLSNLETHQPPCSRRASSQVDKRAATIQARIRCTGGKDAMFEFWKRPKFWAALILVLWIAYILNETYQIPPVTLRLVPWFVTLQVNVSAIVIVSAVAGFILTLVIQFYWRRRSSKNASVSTAAAATSSSPVA